MQICRSGALDTGADTRHDAPVIKGAWRGAGPTLATVIVTAIAVVACSSDGRSSCADLRRKVDDLTRETYSSLQAWNDINELQKHIGEIEQLKARLASDCSG